MAGKYTLREVRQLKGPARSRESAKDRKKAFWKDLDNIEESISAFAELMLDKMFDKAAEGYSGWDDEENKEYLEKQIRSHIEKADYVDVANIAMMLHLICPKQEQKAR